MPEALYGSADAVGPTHFTQAVGCRVIDVDGNEYLDCTMALGAVALGYAETERHARRRRRDRARQRLGALELCAKSKSPSDCAASFRAPTRCSFSRPAPKRWPPRFASRARTRRATSSLRCGYFGWLDWCADDAAGVPEATRNDSRGAFRSTTSPRSTAAVSEAGARLAAIVIEPVVERLPSKEWITRARELATSSGAVLIFDEIKTGFRLRTGGYQEFAEVVPDLAAFGKAMANGYPLSVVCGHRDIMDAARKTWISSTLASEGAALAAADAVLTWHDTADVCESLGAIGAEMRSAVTRAIEASGRARA